MSRLRLLVGSLLLSNCVCVTSPPPAECSPCGLRMQVFSMRGAGDVLTRAECEKLCAAAWCDAKPLGDASGCRLVSTTELICDPVLADCGETLPRPCGPSNCAGCCQADGQCVTSLSCGGRACVECTADSRCNTTNCAAAEACGAQLGAMPRWSACARVDGGFQQPAVSPLDCVDACRASDAGAALACAATLTSCDDAGVSFAAQCAGDAGVSATCAADCETARVACEQACPLTSSDACAQCAKNCGLAFGRCLGDCP